MTRLGALKKPTGYPYTPPFRINRAGSVVTEDFNPDDYLVPSSVTYYFSNSGNDANDGLSAEQPKKKISTVITALNAAPPAGVTFILTSGQYLGSDGIAGLSINFPCNIICQSGRAQIYFKDTRTWSKTAGRTNIYQSTTTRTNPASVDLASTDSYGIAKRLKVVADLGVLDATPGAIYTTGGVLYMHTHDSRSPDASIVTFSNVTSAWTQTTSQQIFMQNIDFWGYLQPVFIGGSAAARYVFDGCTFSYSYDAKNGFETSSSTHADTLTIMHNCTAAYNSYDGFGYRGAHKAIEIDCKGVYNGFVGTNDADNGSTAHENVTTLRINGIYRYNGDRNVHDVNNTYNWLIGCKAGNAQNGSADHYMSGNFLAGIQGTSSDDPHTWLEACESLGGSAADIGAYGGAIIDTLDCIGFTVTDTEGTALLRNNYAGVWPTSSRKQFIHNPVHQLIRSPIR